MTVNDVYILAKAWMFEKASSNIYDSYIIQVCNKCLAELYNENNMCRMFNGKLPFVDGIQAHQVNTLSDELDYEEEYLYDVLPKGIAANFLMDDDLSKMSIYQTEYNNARVVHQKMVSQDIVDELTANALSASATV